MIQLSLNVLLLMDCVTARCGSPVQPTKMTLARQRVLSSSEVRASDLEHGGSWVRIPSGAQIFSVSSYGWFFTSPFISFMKSIKQWFCVFLHLFRSFLASISLLSYFVFGWLRVLSPFSWVHSSHAITAKVYCSSFQIYGSQRQLFMSRGRQKRQNISNEW